MSDKLMNEIKRAAVGDGKYSGLPSHVYSLFGDALAKLDEVAALEARLSKMERALREIEAIDDPDDMGWIQAYIDWAFDRPYDKRLNRPDAWMKGNRPEALAGESNA